MKKLVLIIIGLFLVTGCGCTIKEQPGYDINKIVSMRTTKMTIANDDYQKVIKILNSIRLGKDKIETTAAYEPLYIMHDNVTYSYALYEDGVVKLSYNDIVLYAKDLKNKDELIKILNDIMSRDNDLNSHIYEYDDTYKSINNERLININDGNNMIKVAVKTKIINVKVHSLEYSDEGSYVDANNNIVKPLVVKEQLGSLDTVNQGENLVIRFDKETYKDGLEISFINQNNQNKSVRIRFIDNKVIFE